MDEESASPFNQLNRGSRGRVAQLIFGNRHSSNNDEAIPLSTLDQIDGAHFQTDDERMIKFIRQSFHQKECRLFEENPQLSGLRYTVRRAIVSEPSYKYNLFVRITYDGARDSHTISNVVSLLKEYWELGEPDLVISVIGGSEKFRMANRHRREIFNSGLIKAISETNCWMLTIGSDTGIAKEVGDAVHECRKLRSNSGKQTACIEIASWGDVRQRNKLICSEPEKLTHIPKFDYEMSDCEGGIGMSQDEQGLNPHRTHFLLVDNGRRHLSSCTAEFRAALEQKIKETFSRTDVVCLCIEGGADSIDQVYESLARETSVLVCEGSGRISDLIASCHYDSRRTKPEFEAAWLKTIQSQLECLFRDNYFQETSFSKSPDQMQEKIAFICNSPHLSIFKFENRINLDLALLRFIMSAQLMSTDKQDEGLELALSWNRDDIAEEIMSKPGYDIEKPLLFHKAIMENKIKFVELFVKKGISVSHYLTSDRLRDLYQKTNGKHLMKAMEIKDQTEIELADVSNLIKQLTYCPGHYYDSGKLPKNYDPFHELFIYAVLFNRPQLALFFWNHCQRPLLLTALIGTWISYRLRKLFKLRRDEICAKEFAEMKEVFETKAICLLEAANNTNPGWAQKLVTTSACYHWTNASCMQIASVANAREFLGHKCCQRIIFREWNRGFRCNKRKFFLSFFFILPVFFDFFVHFYSKRNSTINSREDEGMEIPRGAKAKQHYISKPFIFYSAPVSKFTWHTVFYVLYLTLYSYVMLFEYERDHISKAEYLLYLWQFTFFTDTLKTICIIHGMNMWAKMKYWWERGSFGIWNQYDTLNFILAFFALILRMVWENAHPFTRLIMIANAVIYFQRLFKAFLANSYLGPKVIMIWKMTKELMMFCLFFFVFLLSYSVASQSLMQERRDLYPGIFWHLLGYGLWEIFGEPTEDAMNGLVNGCNNYTGTEWFSSDHAVDCFLRTKPLPIFLTIYLFFSSILLVNMLIAVFSHIFEIVEKNAQQLWRFQMFFLVQEYSNKSVLPPPFIIIENMYWAVRWAISNCFGSPQTPKPSQVDLEFHKLIENVCWSAYAEREKEKEQ